MTTSLAVAWGIRGAIPALIVGLVLLLLRVRDHQLEQRLWRGALAFACALPLLTITVATAGAILTPATPAATTTIPALATLTESLAAPITARVTAPSGGVWSAALTLWLGVSLLLLARVIVGSIGAWRLLRTSVPAPAPIATDTRVRLSNAIAGPATVGSTVLLPEEALAWREADRAAVIAHERNHVQQADFWWQLLARTYASLVWWSPVSWLIVVRLRWLAERLSDAAALRVMPDRAQYATLLLDVAIRARAATGVRLPAFRVTMARHSMLRQRIDALMRAVESTPLLGRARIAAMTAPMLGAASMAMAPLPGASLDAVRSVMRPTAESTPATTDSVTAIPPRTARVDSVTVKLYAARTIDAAAEAAIDRSSNPDSVRQALTAANTTARLRWFVLNPDGTQGASGETPATVKLPVTTPFAVTYCSADPAKPLRVEYRFPSGNRGTADGACARLFRESGRTGTQGVPHPRARR